MSCKPVGRVGLVQGSWDLFHIGHLKYLLEAKKYCEKLIIGMDGDDKIRERKGPGRPIVPENERKEFLELLGIAVRVEVKHVGDGKWSLIKKHRPDVLIVIKENYTDEELEQIKKYCGKVVILPRQAETSTSAKIRKVTIAHNIKREALNNPIHVLTRALSDSTDPKRPTAAAYKLGNRWVTAANKADYTLPAHDIENRTELFYSTVEHAEIGLLRKLGIERLDGAVYCTLFPCDKCMKTLIDKGVETIYYGDDHENRNWSRRSHALAKRYGINTVWLGTSFE